jgi:hypothetical protein
MDSYIIHAVGRRSIAGQLVTSSPTGAGVVTVTNCARRAGCPRLPARYHKRELWFWWWHLLLMGSESWTHAHVRWGSASVGNCTLQSPRIPTSSDSPQEPSKCLSWDLVRLLIYLYTMSTSPWIGWNEASDASSRMRMAIRGCCKTLDFAGQGPARFMDNYDYPRPGAEDAGGQHDWGSNVLEGNRHRDVSTSRKSQYATIDRRTNVRRAEGLSTLGGHCRERACAYAKNARRRAKGNAWLSENPGNDLGRSTGRHDVVVRAAPSGDANSTENRRPIRQMPDSLRNLPTVLRPDTRVSE